MLFNSTDRFTEKKIPTRTRMQFKSRFISFSEIFFFCSKIVSLLYFTRVRILFYLFDPIFFFGRCYTNVFSKNIVLFGEIIKFIVASNNIWSQCVRLAFLLYKNTPEWAGKGTFTWVPWKLGRHLLHTVLIRAHPEMRIRISFYRFLCRSCQTGKKKK